MSFPIPQKLVLNSPFKPDPGLVRTVVASVFNRDVSEHDDLSEAETVAVLGAKILLDMSHPTEHVQGILRFFRKDIVDWTSVLRRRFLEGWQNPGTLTLVIFDNEVATMVRSRGALTQAYYNFVKAKYTEGPKHPVLQFAITLSRLFSLALGDPTDRLYPRLLAEETATENQADQSDH